MGDAPQLQGRTVGVTADRRGEDQVVMFRRLGAEVLLGPTISTVRIPDPAALRARTEEIAASPPDYLIANTGIGIRTWMAAVAEWGLEAPLKEALSGTKLAARGPKAAGALSSAGLTPWWRSPDEQLADVLSHLEAEGLAGRTVALQLHGDDGAEFVARMEAAGAVVTTVPVYEWRPPSDPAPALELIRRVGAGEVDAITFTAGPQIRSMFELAGPAGGTRELLQRLNEERVVIGCIGPVCAKVAEDCGIRDVVVPASWRLGSLVKAVAEAVSSRG